MKTENGNNSQLLLLPAPTKRMAPVAQVTWYRSKWGSAVFELRLDQNCVLAAEHPSLVAAGLHAAGVEVVEFSNVEGPERRNYSTSLPMSLDDLVSLRQLAGDDEELAATLTIMTASMIYLVDMQISQRACGDLPTMLHHWHAACLLLREYHVVNRPHLGVPLDWPEWLWHRLQHTYFPNFTRSEMEQLGAMEPPKLEIPLEL